MKSSFSPRTASVGRCAAAATFSLIATFAFEHGVWAQEPAAAPTATAAPAEAPPAATAPADAPAAEAPKAEPAPAEPAVAPAAAETAPAAAEAAAPAEPPPPPPYSLPWQLRPVTAGTVLRLDTAFAFYENPTTHNSGSTVAPMLLFSYKVVKGFAPLVRLGVVSNSPPDTVPPAPPSESGFAFLNPVLGATYALELSKQLKLAFFLGLTIPVGSAGGNSPDAGDKAALSAGIRARSAMDNAMFSVNDFTIFPGVDFAFVAGGFTAQAEATLLQLSRVRGSGDPSTDSSKTNLTMGLHAGYFLIPMLSLGAEIRHQRFLSTPKAVAATPANRDTSTIAIGPRFHFQVSKGKWLRPGIAFAFGIDEPLTKSSYKIVQLDIPFAF